MNTAQIWQTESSGLEDTLQLAAQIGCKLRGGEMLELISDLGGGKTVFVSGLARGMGSKDPVRSPSFTISNQYKAGNLTLYHFDFYRLNKPGIIQDELREVLNDPRAVVAVEWADIVQDVLPANRLTISLKANGNNSRELSFECPEQLKYLIPNNT